MTQVQTEKLLNVTFDGKKEVLVTLTGLVISTVSAGTTEVLLGDLEEVVEVIGPWTPVPAQVDAKVFEYGAVKSTANPKNGVILKSRIQSLLSGANTWAAATTANVAAATFEFLAYGI